MLLSLKWAIEHQFRWRLTGVKKYSIVSITFSVIFFDDLGLYLVASCAGYFVCKYFGGIWHTILGCWYWTMFRGGFTIIGILSFNSLRRNCNYYRSYPGKNATNTTNILDILGTAWVSANYSAGARHKSTDQVTGQPSLIYNYKIKFNEAEWFNEERKSLT